MSEQPPWSPHPPPPPPPSWTPVPPPPTPPSAWRWVVVAMVLLFMAFGGMMVLLVAVGAAASRGTATRRNLIERVVESGARTLADQFHDELAGLVTGTIERWDAAETSTQLELLLGRDLQYIRINGTVVGAGVGLILHAIVLALG